MVPFNLKVLAKFGLCSNCSQKLHGCSLARARKIFATAHMVAFSLTCARLLEMSPYLWLQSFFNSSASGKFTKYSKCSLLAICIFLKCSLLAICIFLSKVLAARHLHFSEVLAARKKNLTTARARKNKHTARMLANTRKDHLIPLLG